MRRVGTGLSRRRRRGLLSPRARRADNRPTSRATAFPVSVTEGESPSVATLGPKSGSQQRQRAGGALRWVAGRLLGLGLDMRTNLALFDERKGPRPPLLRIAINWRSVMSRPSAATPIGLRKVMAREVGESLLDAVDVLRNRGAEPDFPTWGPDFKDSIDAAADSFVALLVDGEDPRGFWETFLREFQVAYPQLKQRAVPAAPPPPS